MEENVIVRLVPFVALVVVALALAACGGTNTGGPASAPSVQAPEVVQVKLTEFKVEPSKTEFQRGKPYRFVISNSGSIAHEWVISPRGATEDGQFLTEVEEDELPAGKSQTHDFTFSQAGEFEMACHVPGHHEAGMTVPITVK